jgi:hypothetical protein
LNHSASIQRHRVLGRIKALPDGGLQDLADYPGLTYRLLRSGPDRSEAVGAIVGRNRAEARGLATLGLGERPQLQLESVGNGVGSGLLG